jgi:hypothetical protein
LNSTGQQAGAFNNTKKSNPLLQSNNSFSAAGMPYQQFDDSLEQFVQILKMTTQAIEVNIFSKETVLIYADVEAQ